jgi:integrase
MASVRKLKKDDPASPWIVEYTDPSTGKRVRKTPKSGLKKDADALRRKIEAEIDGGIHTAPSTSPTIADLGDTFVRNAAERLSDGRIGRSRYAIIVYTVENCLKPHLGRMKLCGLKREDVEGWYNWLRKEKKLAPVTSKGRVIIFQMIEDFAVRRSWTKLTPVRDYLKDLTGIRQSRVRTFSAEQAAQVLATAAHRAPGFKLRAHAYTECMVNLAACCGLRYGEILGLSLDDVFFDDRRLYIRHSLTDWDELKGPKTVAGVRNIPLPQHVADMLTAWIANGYVANERRLLFRTSSGGIISAASFHKATWGPLLIRAGLGEGKRFHFHALRHFASSWMIANGLPVTDVARLMGHSHFDTTLQVYAHPVIANHRHQEAFDRMASNLKLELPAPGETSRDMAPA